ncbi:EAL domain-containing protein [Thiocystis violacea]|uniref:EAL domain-containing protein n=1 Tax=Thiocystis violacea TaxID=13725 RepID=UPI001905089E|nr:EAL domain-containing protein [Thiocystis violacea]MBK1718813.1 diguanylate phosphodiesterase [Thiocystis violacea]
MTKVKKILCIHPEPEELRISALLNRRGLAVDLVDASTPDAIKAGIAQPQWWDLVLCDEGAYFNLDLSAEFDAVKDRLDASLVLLKSSTSQLTPADGLARGAADVVCRDSLDHLLLVCEREIGNGNDRKQLRQLRHSVLALDSDVKGPVVLATINDLSKNALARYARESGADPSEMLDPARVRSLIDAGGLTLEYQPIVSFKADETHRNMFETLVRLKDERGGMLFPDAFLPLVAEAGWMGKIDLWIFRQALAVLEQMQSGGAPDATLFVNMANQTLLSESTVKAIGAFVTAAHLAPGSIVVEVRKSAFDEAPDGIKRLVAMLQLKQHGLLVEDPKLDDRAFLEANRGVITHVKLSRDTMQGLVEGRASQAALNGFVRCAHNEGLRVIALAVDSTDLMPMLHSAGVDAIQGNFMSMPNQELMYPSVTLFESGTLLP